MSNTSDGKDVEIKKLEFVVSVHCSVFSSLNSLVMFMVYNNLWQSAAATNLDCMPRTKDGWGRGSWTRI